MKVVSPSSGREDGLAEGGSASWRSRRNDSETGAFQRGSAAVHRYILHT
jgi:hypothetical protein